MAQPLQVIAEAAPALERHDLGGDEPAAPAAALRPPVGGSGRAAVRPRGAAAAACRARHPGAGADAPAARAERPRRRSSRPWRSSLQSSGAATSRPRQARRRRTPPVCRPRRMAARAGGAAARDAVGRTGEAEAGGGDAELPFAPRAQALARAGAAGRAGGPGRALGRRRRKHPARSAGCLLLRRVRGAAATVVGLCCDGRRGELAAALEAADALPSPGPRERAGMPPSPRFSRRWRAPRTSCGGGRKPFSWRPGAGQAAAAGGWRAYLPFCFDFGHLAAPRLPWRRRPDPRRTAAPTATASC